MQNIDWKKQLGHLGYFLLTTFVVSAAAFFNKFPLVQEASGRFLLSGFTLEPPPGETGSYGLFIRMVSWQASAWPIVIAQAAILNTLLMRSTALLLPSFSLRRIYFPIVVILAMLSGMSWVTGTILPDIFLSFIFLGTFIWFVDREMKAGFRVMLGVLLVFSWSAQVSHLLFGIVGLFAFAGFWVLRRNSVSREARKMGVAWAGTIVAALLLVPIHNAFTSKGFRFNLSSDIHLFARTVENGMLARHLEENGPADSTWILAYTEGEVWTASEVKLDRDSLLLNAECNAWADPDGCDIPGGTLNQLGEYLEFTAIGLRDAVRQLLVSDFTRYDYIWMDEERPYAHNIARVIHDRLPHAYGEYMNDRQNRVNLRLELLPYANLPLLGLCGGFLLWGMGKWRRERQWLLFMALLLDLVLLNALVQGLFFGVNDLAGARVMWWLVYAGLVFGVKAFFTNVKN
jgi:hypothetical protein